MSDDGYVLITPVRNEEAHIETTIGAILSQTRLPKEWVIVNDRSTDRTEEIVRRYIAKYDFIRLVCRSGDGGRDFAAKVQAFRLGYELLQEKNYGYIGNLDGDVSFDSDYYEQILARFSRNAGLGVAGGFIYERDNGTFVPRPFNTVRSVAGAVQLFRRDCFEAIGGLLPLKFGAEDTCAEVMARMRGWATHSFEELRVFHHRHTGGGSTLRARLNQGRAEFELGNHPVFEGFKCLRRLAERPFFVGALFRLAGFISGAVQTRERVVDREFVRHLRREQVEVLWRVLRTR
jgi:biofilm PGA synthesis N-glycosyltransferase PgaC